jgi:hypothetical protein
MVVRMVETEGTRVAKALAPAAVTRQRLLLLLNL